MSKSHISLCRVDSPTIPGRGSQSPAPGVLAICCHFGRDQNGQIVLDPHAFRANFGVPLRGSADIPPIDH